MATVDNHVEWATVGSHHGQTAGDEGLVLDGIKSGVEVELVDEFLGTPSHGIDKMVAGILNIPTFVVAHQCDIVTSYALHMQQLAVLVVGATLLHAYPAYVVNHSTRCCLPAVAGDEGVAVGVAAVVPQGRNLLLEVFALHHVGIAPSAGGIQRAVCSVVVNQIDIMRSAVVDVMLRLHLLEDFMVVDGDVGNVGIGERRTAAADATPGGSAAVVDHHRLLACLGEVAEQGAACNAATGYQHLHLFLLHTIGLGIYKGLGGAGGVEVGEGHLVRQGRTGRGVTHQLYAIGAEYLTGTRDAAFATTGTHAETGDMFQLVHRDGLAVANHTQHAVELDVLAMAHVGLALDGTEGFQCQWFGVILLDDKTFDVGNCTRVLHHLHTCQIGLVGFLHYLLNHTLANLLSVVVHQEHLGAFLHLVFDRQEADALLLVVAEDGQTGTRGDALHTANALVVVHRWGAACGGFGDCSLRAGEAAGVAGKAIQAVQLHKRLHGHTFWRGQCRFLQYADRMLLRVDILARDVQILVVVEADADSLCHLVSHLTATEHRTGTFADADGIACAIGVETEYLAAFHQQLVVGDKSCADIDDVDVVDNLFRAGDGLEVLALGDNGSGDASIVGVGDGTHQCVTCHDGDTQPAHTVGLHGETALTGHRLDNGLDSGTRLHALIGGEVADIAGTHGEDTLAQQGVLLIHHLLEDGGGVDTRHVVILERGHKRHGTCSHDQMFGVDIRHLARDNILDSHTAAFKQIPHRIVEQDTLLAVACKGLGNIETAHAAELLLLLEEEELVGLHIELATDTAIVVNHQIADAESIQLLAAGQTCRTGTDDGHLCLIYLHLAGLMVAHFGPLVLVCSHRAYLFHTVHRGNADAAHLSVDKHLAGTALTDAAIQAAVAPVDTVTVYRIARLMEGCCYRIAFRRLHSGAVIKEFNRLALRDVKNRM